MVEEFVIRPANIDDIKKVFELSNDDVVRQNSIRTEKIQWEDHVKWFTNRIENTEEPFYIAENPNGNFVAQIRFNKEDGEFVISVSINKDYRGRGLGSKIIAKAGEKLGKTPIIAYVKTNNIPSQKSFLKSGYQPVGEKIINNENYIKYVLN